MVTNRTVPYSYQPYQMRYTADFGTFGVTENGMGIPMPTFVSQFKLHYARVSQTISQKYEHLARTLKTLRFWPYATTNG